MFQKVYETQIDASVEELWAFHSSAESLLALSPPGRQIQPLGDDLSVTEGNLHKIRFKQFGIPMEWHARISEVQPPNGFTDTCEKGPFPYWKHRHAFIKDGEKSLLRDTIEYRAPGLFLSRIINRLLVEPDLDRLFAFRHAVTKKNLEGATSRGE